MINLLYVIEFFNPSHGRTIKSRAQVEHFQQVYTLMLYRYLR